MVQVRNVQNRQKFFVEGGNLVVCILELLHAVRGAEPNIVSLRKHGPNLVGAEPVTAVVMHPFVFALGRTFFFGGTAFKFCLTATCGGVVRQVAPYALVGCDPNAATLVHRNIVHLVVGKLHLFPLTKCKVRKTSVVGGPHMSRTVDSKCGRGEVHNAVFLVEQAPTVLVVQALFRNKSCDTCAFNRHVKFLAVFRPHECADFLAREHFTFLFKLTVAVNKQTVFGTDPNRGPLTFEGGNAVVSEFLVVVLPSLAVKTVKGLGCTYPELFGAAFVKDCCNGILDNQVPGHLDFDHVLFVVGRFDVVELLHLAYVFVEAAFSAHINLDGVADLGVTLQRNGMVVHPLFAVEFLNTVGSPCPKFALAKETVLGTRSHARKIGGVLGIGGVAHAPFVGQWSKGKACRVVVHGSRVVGEGGTGFAHTQLTGTNGHFERDNGRTCRKSECGRKNESCK